MRPKKIKSASRKNRSKLSHTKKISPRNSRAIILSVCQLYYKIVYQFHKLYLRTNSFNSTLSGSLICINWKYYKIWHNIESEWRSEYGKNARKGGNAQDFSIELKIRFWNLKFPCSRTDLEFCQLKRIRMLRQICSASVERLFRSKLEHSIQPNCPIKNDKVISATS